MEARRSHLPRRAALAVATLLSVIASLGAGFVAGGAMALGPLPACRYDDITTSPRGYTDWATTLVDTILRVPSSYVPPDLVAVSQAGLAGSGKVRKVALEDLTSMTAAAKAAGAPIAVQSAYRSYSQQKTTFQSWVARLGYKAALKVSARPGHSEHQLGLAIDFRSDAGGPPWEGDDWGKSPAGKWMLANAWQFGWLLSYPKGEEATACYSYEPWHYRYVGRGFAQAIHDSGLTTRAWLWGNVTTAEVPPPGASGSPTASGSPGASESPGGSPTLAPSLEPSLASTASPAPAATVEPSPAPGASPSSGEIPGGATAVILVVVAGIVALLGIGALRRRA